MVVLYEMYFSTDGSFKLSLIEALEEEASVVTEYFGFEQDDVGNGEWGGFHFKVQDSRSRGGHHLVLDRAVRITRWSIREISSAS